MNREFLGVSESDRLRDAAELMRSEPAEAVIVLRGSEPIGSLSTATALAAMLDGDPDDQLVGEVMEPPAPTVGPETALSTAADHLISRGTSHLMVVDDDEAVGLLTERDLLTATETVEASTVTSQSTEGDTQSAGGVVADSQESGAVSGSAQGICEGCGSLTPELATENGQLVCPACRAY